MAPEHISAVKHQLAETVQELKFAQEALVEKEHAVKNDEHKLNQVL